MKGTRPVRIANCSGFFGDRISAAREMVDPAVLDDSPVDVLTGDWLAELTMLILHKQRARDAEAGYAGTFLTQMEQVLGTCIDRGIKVVTNAGGLNPAGCARKVRDLGTRLGLDVNVAHVEGDDILDRIDGLRPQLTNLDTGAPFTATAVSANAYLGGWGIARALAGGADVVVCPRVTDAAVVVGPAAWWWDWAVDDWDALAGAVVAGHVIECGAQTTGGNYSWFGQIAEPGQAARLPDRRDRPRRQHHDHQASGHRRDRRRRLRSPPSCSTRSARRRTSTRTSPPTSRRSRSARTAPTASCSSGTCGSPAPDKAKVSINCEGGYRNRMTFVLTGLDQQAKADWVRDQLFIRLGGEDRFDEVDVRFVPAPPDADRPGGRLRPPARQRQEHRRASRRSQLLVGRQPSWRWPAIPASSPPPRPARPRRTGCSGRRW